MGRESLRLALLLLAAFFVLAAHSAQAAGPNSGANAGLIQPDGKIVAVGWSEGSGIFGLARYTRSGALDRSFGSGGKVAGPASWLTGAGAVALQSNGKIVAAGRQYTGSNFDFTIARYTPAGSLDKTFGKGGTVRTTFGSPIAGASAVVIQADGKIVAAGQLQNGSRTGFVLARYTPAGLLDRTFGTAGRVTTPVGGGSGGVTAALAIQPDGKIVMAGSSAGAFTLARYAADGSLDPSFGTGGIATTAIKGLGGAAALALQPDGKIVAAGSGNTISQYNSSFVLSRYDADGALDPSFGTGGIVSTAFYGTSCDGCDDNAYAVALQPDGKLVAAGDTCVEPCQFALARYNADGSLDTSFGTGGKVTTSFGPHAGGSHARAVALQSDGKLVAVGSARLGSPARSMFAVARYKPDGSLDASFGHGGRATTRVAACVVPRLYGETLSWAKQATARAHCALGKVSSAYSRTVEKGAIFSQEPTACALRQPGVKVSVTVSKGARHGKTLRPTRPGPIAYDSVSHLGCGGGGSGSSNIWTIEPNGSGRMQVASGQNAVRPAWSPDGRKIVFTRGNPGDIFLMDANGSHLRRVVRGSADHPTFSPDGKRLAYRTRSGIWTARTDGKDKHKIVSGGLEPAWSPDGKRIAFVESGVIYTVSAEGGSRKAVVRGGSAFFQVEPVWAPSGKQIAFLMSTADGWDLAVVNVSTGSTGVVVRSVDADARPAWSPDGKRIAYVRYGSTSQELMIARATGGGVHLVTRMIGGPQGISWRR